VWKDVKVFYLRQKRNLLQKKKEMKEEENVDGRKRPSVN
jgi:hypothetical protein